MKRIVMGMVVAMMAGAGVAKPVVSDVVCKQRYPWNGKVDITFTVSGVTQEDKDADRDEDKITVFTLSTTNYVDGVGQALKMKTFTDAAGRKVYFSGIAVTNGVYHYVWDADADLSGAEEKIRYGTVRSTVATTRIMVGVQLWEGGPYWALCNVGAEKPEETGLYFWWGGTVGYEMDNTTTSTFNFTAANESPSLYNKRENALISEGYCESRNGKTVLSAAYDAATVNLGEPWRLPTSDEISQLVNTSVCRWSYDIVNGMPGYRVHGLGDFAGKSVFFPMSGSINSTTIASYGNVGVFWAADPKVGTYYISDAYGLAVTDTTRGGIRLTSAVFYYGSSVRAVHD